MVASVHKYLTQALRTNGNLARNWIADDKEARTGEETLATGTWLLTHAGEPYLILTIDYIPKDAATGTVKDTPVGEEAGAQGKIEHVYEFLRKRGKQI
ncbi:MAG TPA: hypothetical protein VKU00_22045 [Chthonomonadaceae bacterium]|nr:hypothetical protein [Chthonomonadaceae bacterium]